MPECFESLSHPHSNDLCRTFPVLVSFAWVALWTQSILSCLPFYLILYFGISPPAPAQTLGVWRHWDTLSYPQGRWTGKHSTGRGHCEYSVLPCWANQGHGLSPVILGGKMVRTHFSFSPSNHVRQSEKDLPGKGEKGIQTSCPYGSYFHFFLPLLHFWMLWDPCCLYYLWLQGQAAKRQIKKVWLVQAAQNVLPASVEWRFI